MEGCFNISMDEVERELPYIYRGCFYVPMREGEGSLMYDIGKSHSKL